MPKSQGTENQSFGEFLHIRRVATGLSLRTFCERFGYDPAYISRLERDRLTPPEDKSKLEALARAVGLKEASVEWVTFFDLAYLSKGKIPEDISNDDNMSKNLPLLFRTVRGKKLSREQLKKLQELLEKA